MVKIFFTLYYFIVQLRHDFGRLNNLNMFVNLQTFVISENCLRSTTNVFVSVFDEQVNHVSQNTNVFKVV